MANGFMGEYMTGVVFSEPLAKSPRDQYGAWMVRLSALIAVLALGHSGWQFIHSLPHTAPTMAQTDAAAPTLPGVEPITQRQWFGVAAGDALRANETSNLVLKGISRTEDATIAGAFIAEAGKPEHFYRVGDPLPGESGTLQSVAADHVVIMRDGTYSRLNFATPNASGTRPSSPSVGAAGSPFVLLPPDAPKGESLAKVTPAELAKRFISDPDALLAAAGLEKIATNGKTGYALGGGSNAALFERAGMNRGDVVLAINGHTVGNPASDRLLVPGLLTTKTIEVDVLRNGKKQRLSVPVP